MLSDWTQNIHKEKDTIEVLILPLATDFQTSVAAPQLALLNLTSSYSIWEYIHKPKEGSHHFIYFFSPTSMWALSKQAESNISVTFCLHGQYLYRCITQQLNVVFSPGSTFHQLTYIYFQIFFSLGLRKLNWANLLPLGKGKKNELELKEENFLAFKYLKINYIAESKTTSSLKKTPNHCGRTFLCWHTGWIMLHFAFSDEISKNRYNWEITVLAGANSCSSMAR